ncbi:hypothetical protein ACFPRL_34245 [Pseudoclavibacter helvolus]
MQRQGLRSRLRRPPPQLSTTTSLIRSRHRSIRSVVPISAGRCRPERHDPLPR